MEDFILIEIKIFLELKYTFKFVNEDNNEGNNMAIFTYSSLIIFQFN